jgi:hypothetical protein
MSGRRAAAAMIVLGMLFVTLLGAVGLGADLVLEGLRRNNTTFAALGVALVIATLLVSGAAGWKISGPGFEALRERIPPSVQQSTLPVHPSGVRPLQTGGPVISPPHIVNPSREPIPPEEQDP